MIHVGGRPLDLLAAAFWVVMTGKWSLPRYGPSLIVSVTASPGDVKVRSIVEFLPVDGSTLVPKSMGVMMQAFCVYGGLGPRSLTVLPCWASCLSPMRRDDRWNFQLLQIRWGSEVVARYLRFRSPLSARMLRWSWFPLVFGRRFSHRFLQRWWTSWFPRLETEVLFELKSPLFLQYDWVNSS